MNPWQSGTDTAQFGDVAFDVVDTSGDRTRAIRVVEYDGVDGGQLVDQGGRLRVTQVRAIFAGADQIEQFQKLAKLNDGKPRLFVHPLLGAYEARITGFRPSVSAAEVVVSVAIEFTEEGAAEDELVIDEPLDVGSGLSAVTVRAEEASAALAMLELEDGAFSAARQAAAGAPGMVSAWREDSAAAAEVQAQVTAQVEAIDAGLRALEARSDVEAIDAHRSLLRLRMALMATADQLAPARATTVIRVARDTPALALAADFGEFEGFAAAVLELNPESSALALSGLVEVPTNQE
ncbi:MAG: DNA circularization N-terminal domain-containing protein [Myxococcota bacterium]